MTDPNKPTTVLTQPAAGGQQVVTNVLPHGAKPVSVAEVAAASPQSANALLQATHMLDPMMGMLGGANPAMTAMQSAIAHRGAEAASETPQMPTTLKEHGKMTFVDAPKQHATAQFEAPALLATKTHSTGASGAAKPAEANPPNPKAKEHPPKQQTAPAADDGSDMHNGGHKRKHSQTNEPAAVADAAAAPAADKDKAPAVGEKAQTTAAAENTVKTSGDEVETAAKSTHP